MLTIHRPNSELLEELAQQDPRISYYPVDEETAKMWMEEMGSTYQFLFDPKMNKTDFDRNQHTDGLITHVYTNVIESRVVPDLRKEYTGREIGFRGITTTTGPDFEFTVKNKRGEWHYLVKNVVRTLKEGCEVAWRDEFEGDHEFTRAYWDRNFQIPDCWVISPFSFYPAYFKENTINENQEHIFPALLIYSPDLFGKRSGFRTNLPDHPEARERLILRACLFDYIELDLDEAIKTFGTK
ncbi:hypothetical protein HOE37_05815 [Candidatus Woesearchaeota archaeon]|jgi:hypothetical protein|nr:hypothetical protein [Candidatus Woesearchaeota archaeon]MBT4111350.1 hypothetical protein [Candidatus Woesearchaeota archaeon]MBT4336471.1 hypothetical protein [Candidatus Woesearchaeota archaeon]MBT4469884.1 hypothetical protein [Candidatus Woesearchaeota archaeon]MBT6744445.1 hypothetical protein [Candidatus Woesearchaeota archaeon]